MLVLLSLQQENTKGHNKEVVIILGEALKYCDYLNKCSDLMTNKFFFYCMNQHKYMFKKVEIHISY